MPVTQDNPGKDTDSQNGQGGINRFAGFVDRTAVNPPRTYQQIIQLKVALAAGIGQAESIRDYGGLWGVHGYYLLEGARLLKCRYAEMVDVTPVPEFDQKVAELKQSMPVEVKMTRGDFRDPGLFRNIPAVDVSLLYEVLLHQDNAVEVIKNVLSRTKRAVCVAQPVMKEQLFPLPGASVLLQFYPEELKDMLRYPAWWEKEPICQRFDTRFWMWGQTVTFLKEVFYGYGWGLVSSDRYHMSDYWDYALLRFAPRGK